MRYAINSFLIKTLHRKFRLPKAFVYHLVIFLNKVTFAKKYSHFINPTNSQDYKTSNQGYILFDHNANDLLMEVTKVCCSLFDQKVSKFSREEFQNNPRKDFLLTVDSNDGLLTLPEINRFVKSDFVLDNVSSILKAPFIINSARLWWSPVNTSELSSQLYHFDEEDLTQVKLFINIKNVSLSSGPFTFLSRKDSKIVTKYFRNGKRRFTDHDIYTHIDERNAIKLVGESGSGAFIDTSNCMHYGSRNNETDRLVLMMQFLRTNAPLITKSINV